MSTEFSEGVFKGEGSGNPFASLLFYVLGRHIAQFYGYFCRFSSSRADG